MNSQGSFLLTQLGYQIPMIVVCVVAVILALVFLKRAPLPALLTLLGATVLMTGGIGTAVLQSLVITSRPNFPNGPGNMMWIIALGGRGAHALGLALLVAAVFIGRNEPRDYDGDFQE